MSSQPVNVSAPTRSGWFHNRRARLAFVGVLAASATIAVPLQGASAVGVPVFPDNLVVFPDRDFVTIEGFQDHVGDVATVEVTRGSQVVGSAKSLVAAGDVAFEINHPGGVCWGADTSLKVTPDIVAGDKVSISFPNGESFDTTVQDAAVTAKSVLNGDTLTVTGHIGAGVVPGQFEQRIINPDLVDTDVARRDVRALPGPVVPSDKGGYSSGLTVSGDTFTATYVFANTDTAAIAAAGGGERAMTWQVEDGDGNRQGLSIAEFGELGGPGMGGCPAGPADQGAPAGSYSSVVAADKASAQVNWTAATPVPGAAAVTGYSVVALGTTDGGVQTQAGVRVGASATRATLTGLDPAKNYTYEVRSIAGGAMSAAFSAIASTPTTPADTTTPRLTVSPAAGASVVETNSVTATSEAGADLYYAVGTSAISGDVPSDAAKLYTGPIPVTGEVTLHFAAFDRAGNSETAVGTYKPVSNVPVLAAPGNVAATAGQASARITWGAVAGATAYRVTATPAGGVATTTEVTAQVATLTGLTAGTPYTFTVATKNSANTYGAESSSVSATPTAVTDRVSITLAKWRTGDFRIGGSGTATGAIISVRTGGLTGPVIGQAVVAAPVAPATAGEYTLRLRNAAAGTRNPGQVWVTSDKGGVAGPFTVTNG